MIREAQAALFPTLTGTYTVTRTYNGPKHRRRRRHRTGAGASAHLHDDLHAAASAAAWDLDVWGKVRAADRKQRGRGAGQRRRSRQRQALGAGACSPPPISICARRIRCIDLLDRTRCEYKKTLDIVQNQFKAGYSVTAGDVATARGASLDIPRRRPSMLGVQRAQYEHAIAMLIGRPPAELSDRDASARSARIPRIPVTVPSALLERRPDIAAAERTMQEQNALIGVAVAAYFPDISLSAHACSGPARHPLPFNVANEVWSLGAAGTQMLFNGGLRGAQVDAARAVYWQSVANYRQTVLTAFQRVEDELVAMRLLTPAARGPAQGGQGRSAGRRRLSQSVPGRHRGVHHRGHGGNHAAGRRGSGTDHPSEPVPRQRQP